MSDTPKNARCHTQIYQTSVAFGHRVTSLVLACSDTVDGVAPTVFTVRGRSESFRLQWVDDDTLRVEYAADAKVRHAEPTIVLRDRSLKIEYVPVKGDTGAGCDFEKDNILNIAS
jgi:hypothetical protein